MINAESAKCAGGDTTTNFVWDTAALTATCSSTWDEADILAYVNLQDGGLGMSNAFDSAKVSMPMMLEMQRIFYHLQTTVNGSHGINLHLELLILRLLFHQ